MSDDEINEVIARAIGASYHKPTPEEIESGSYCQYEPDFCRDLNLMHGIEKRLNDVEQRRYAMELHGITEAGHSFGRPMNYWIILHATARQRAEAFLKTIGKWREPDLKPALTEPKLDP